MKRYTDNKISNKHEIRNKSREENWGDKQGKIVYRAVGRKSEAEYTCREEMPLLCVCMAVQGKAERREGGMGSRIPFVFSFGMGSCISPEREEKASCRMFFRGYEEGMLSRGECFNLPINFSLFLIV